MYSSSRKKAHGTQQPNVYQTNNLGANVHIPSPKKKEKANTEERSQIKERKPPDIKFYWTLQHLTCEDVHMQPSLSSLGWCNSFRKGEYMCTSMVMSWRKVPFLVLLITDRSDLDGDAENRSIDTCPCRRAAIFTLFTRTSSIVVNVPPLKKEREIGQAPYSTSLRPFLAIRNCSPSVFTPLSSGISFLLPFPFPPHSFTSV
ncbi:hypothetical protein ACTXT7_003115 [Hymenolepis weldensis]